VHIPDGLVSAQASVVGYGLTGLVTWATLRRIRRQQKDPTAQIPKASLMTAAFFVASSLSVPVGPASVHLVLNGMVGTVLGAYAFSAILVGLVFQAVIIGHGGLTTLGLNALIMGVPALLARPLFLLYRRVARPLGLRRAMGLFAFLAGGITFGLAVLLFFGIVLLTLDARFDAAAERQALFTLVLAHGPLMLIEGGFTALLVLFLQRVKPALLEDGL
jgi:cobalt/nickel transport system permease protein